MLYRLPRSGWLLVCSVVAASFFAASPARALELDWSGQFRAEYNYIHNYTLDGTPSGDSVSPTRQAAGGYYVTPGGSNDASFEDLFMRLKPKITVNDNVYIKSEFWLGDPVFGLFGNGVPYSNDLTQYYSTGNRGSVITAQRYWAEFLTDVGTVQVGRAPLNWGLGIVWNAGDDMWARYMSTADTIRFIAKFGSFSFSPAYIVYSTGNAVGGACLWGPANGGIFCNPAPGSGGVQDYSLLLKYENPEEDMEVGVNFIRQIAGGSESEFNGPSSNPPATPPATGPSSNPVSPVAMNYNVWDIYGKKKIGKFTIAGEVPIIAGNLGGATYNTFAVAAEAGYKFSDSWDTGLKLGHAPGQEDSTSGVATQFHSFTFHPNYHLGLIMFNYQFANFAGPNTLNDANATNSTLLSPYDNPITNANYLSWNGAFHTDKWDFHTVWTFARANETAENGQYFWNIWQRRYVLNNSGLSQDPSLGWEMDYGITFQWDESFQVGVDAGWWFPGAFYTFSNTSISNQTSPVFGTLAKVGISF